MEFPLDLIINRQNCEWISEGILFTEAEGILSQEPVIEQDVAVDDLGSEPVRFDESLE